MAKYSKFSGFFKLIDVEPTPVKVSDNVSFDSVTVGNVSGWYSNIVTGSGNRMSRYSEYDLMDTDVEVSRALDIIAEEATTGNNEDTINVEIDPNTLTDSEQVTVNTALSRWMRMVELDTNLFHIVRNTIKYGDVVFKRTHPFGKWEHIPIKLVSGAFVDTNNPQHVLGLVINKSSKMQNPVAKQFNTTTEEDMNVEPINDLIRFTLNDNMSESAPFGKSILANIYKAYQQKKLVEDAIIIYRVQRAPERRVFYIDVGRMPPQRRKAYLEQIKLEMRQRKIPALNNSDPNTTVDTIYDPQDMMEDFYLAVGAEGKGSKIEVLPGGHNLGELKDLEYFSNKLFEGLRVPLNWYRSENPANVSDGKIGVSYVQELQFTKYVKRLQQPIERALDAEFKVFLKNVGIRIDENSFRLKLAEPSNFECYKKAEVDAALLNVYSQVTNIPHLSPRFTLVNFLQLTENQMIENERLRREELGISENDPLKLMKIYSPEAAAAAGGGDMGGGGFGGGGAGDFSLPTDSGTLDQFAPPGGEEAPGGEVDGAPAPEAPPTDKASLPDI